MSINRLPSEIPVPTKTSFFAGWVLTILPSLLFAFSGVMKLVGHFTQAPDLIKGFNDLQIPVKLILPIGIIEILCLVVYLIPKTAVLGAILLTGYMGGAILTHLRVGEAVVMQVIIGVVVWIALYLREPRLRMIAPLRRG
ncbi:MAG: DoxX family protein [Phycisphaerales bacterium]|nr:DoxX family protein [Phycisphaerales bacterium]